MAPSGVRSSGADLGAWYAAAAANTAIAKIGLHPMREAVAVGSAELRRTYRTYVSSIGGTLSDMRGQTSALPHV